MTAYLYSRIADEQLDLIEAADPDLYECVLEACQLVLEEPTSA
ncbi:MAG: hypothetical protein QG597_4523 [Actinomycetota bacterium]|nr:hypothetical protein [Actinomycetota bacterium]